MRPLRPRLWLVAAVVAATTWACSSSTPTDGDGDVDAAGDADVDAAQPVDLDGDGWTSEEGDCDDAAAHIYPGSNCPCPDGLIDCDGDDSNGCELAVEDAPEEYHEWGCCEHYDPWGNGLDDCDGDGHCECYGSCFGDDPRTPEYEEPTCEGE